MVNSTNTGARVFIPPPFFPETAAKYNNNFNKLRIADLLNTPSIAEIGDIWYKDFANAFFGSVDIEKRERLIQEFFVLIPKKNAKSTAAALIMLACLISNKYRGAEFALIASSKEVVANAFIPIREAIELDNNLKSFLKYSFDEREKSGYVQDLRTGAVLKIVTPLMKTNQGKKWQGVLIDEIALWQDIKNSVSILNEISGNLVNKKDAFIIYLTTQSHEPPKGIFKALLEKARRIAKGGIDEILKNKFLPILYEFSDDEIKKEYHKDPTKWHLVNPSLGISVDLERLKQMQIDAINAGAESEREFYAKYLNVEITVSTSGNFWKGADYWQQCEKRISLATVLDKSALLYIGIDGGGLDDLTGLAVLGLTASGEWLVWCKAYCYQSALNRAGLAVKLKDFEKKGEVFIADKLGDDSKQLTADIVDILSKGKVNKIGIDPRGIGEILINLKNAGVNETLIEPINQGVSLQNAVVILERRLAQKEVIISQSDLMRFCVSNAVLEQRGDDYFLSKKSSQFKIDPLMALLNCVALWERYGSLKLAQTTSGKLDNAVAFINALNRKTA